MLCRYVTLHYVTLRYVTLHYVTFHYITLHYTTLNVCFCCSFALFSLTKQLFWDNSFLKKCTLHKVSPKYYQCLLINWLYFIIFKIKNPNHTSHGFFLLLICSPKLLLIKINFTTSLRIPKNSGQDVFGSKRKRFWYSKNWPHLVPRRENQLILVRW